MGWSQFSLKPIGNFTSCCWAYISLQAKINNNPGIASMTNEIIDISKIFLSDLSKTLFELSKNLDNRISLRILEYLNFHENDLFVYNLDKKIFILNIFSPLSNKT